MPNQEGAVAHLDDALGGYGDVGAARDLARVRRRLRRLGVRRRHWASAGRPAAGWASLTHNQVVGVGAHKGVEAEHLDLCPECTNRLREWLDS